MVKQILKDIKGGGKEISQSYWKVKSGGMDFSQYFWSVPSRLDELSGGHLQVQRQETLLETFLVNSLQVEVQSCFIIAM